MPRDPHSPRPQFHVLAFMASLKAARDFGLDSASADAIALRLDPRHGDAGHLVDDLAEALLAGGAVSVPDTA